MLRTLLFGAAIMGGAPSAAFDTSADMSAAHISTAGFLSADRLSEDQLARTTSETRIGTRAATVAGTPDRTIWFAATSPYISSGQTMPEQFDNWNFDVATLLIARALASSGAPPI